MKKNELKAKELKDIKRLVNKGDLKEFFEVAGIASSYEIAVNGIPYVYEGTHRFIQDIKTAQVLQDKFPNMPYNSSDGFQAWLNERLNGSANSEANALNRLIGDAGEVEFVESMRGQLQSLFTKTDFVRDANGHTPSNTPGIDAIEINRFTGNLINEYQVKTLRSDESIGKVLSDFLNNKHYDPNVTLVGPKELIEEAKRQGISNPTKVMGSLEDNAKRAQELKDKVQSGDMATELTANEVIGKVAGGVVVGAAISITISSFFNYLAYKKGEISREELLKALGKDGAKGAICGGALAGLSLFIPGGIIGFGIGMTVGTGLRRIIDDAFGDGTFAKALDLTRSVQANVKMLHNGSVYIAELQEADGKMIQRALQMVDDSQHDRLRFYEKMESVEVNYHDGQFITSNKSPNEVFDKLDQGRKEMRH